MKLEPLAPPPLREVEEDGIRLRELGLTLWRGRWTILAVAFLFTAAALLGVLRMGDRYLATASVMFGTPKMNLADLQEVLVDPGFGKDTLQNEIEVLRSTSLIGRVIEELDLAADPEFNPTLRVEGAGPSEWLRAALRSFSASEAPTDATRRALRERLTVLAQVRKNLTLAPVEGARVIEIGFVASDPDIAAEVVNTIADQYLVDQLVSRSRTTKSAIEWLSGRVEEARQQVRSAENAVESMRSELATEAGQGLDITEQQLVALNTALSAARGETAQAETRYARLDAALAEGVNLATIPEFRDSERMDAYRDEESELVAKLDAISPSHPAVRQMQAQLRDLRAHIRSEAENIVAAAGGDLQAAKAQESSLSASVHALETKSLEQSRSQLRLRQLQREAEANRGIYETMLRRLKETSEQVELQEADARVLSPADPPLAPQSSRKKLIVAMAASVGALAGAALYLLLDQVNDTFRAPRQIPHLTGRPVLAAIPRAGARRPGRTPVPLLSTRPNSALAEAVRNLRTSILFSGAAQPPRVVMFTSSVAREGKTTTALLLALTSCQMGRRTIVVDCDLRRPAVGPTLGAPEGPGLRAVLDGTVELAEAIHTDPGSGLHILTSRPEAGDGRASGYVSPADLLASDAFQVLVRRLAEHYDMVVLDTPPVLAVADARILSAISDTVVYLVRWGRTPRGAVLEGLAELRSLDAPVSGVVVTMIDEAAAAAYPFNGHTYDRRRFRDYYTG